MMRSHHHTLQHLQQMAWCSCCRIASALILAFICLMYGYQNSVDIAVYFGWFFMLYFFGGVVYSICCGCISLLDCLRGDSPSRQQLLENGSDVHPQPYVLEVGDEINRSSGAEREQNHYEDSYRETFHQQDCTICLDNFGVNDVAARLGCGHKFHEKCIVDWLEKQLNCPVCRALIQ